MQAAATVYRADMVDRDRAGLAEVRHGARGFALDSPLEEGGFELSRSLATVSSGGALWRSVASREIGTPERALAGGSDLSGKIADENGIP